MKKITVFNFFMGKFGNKVLKLRYRSIWKGFWATTLFALFLIFMYYLVQGWSWCVDWVQYVING